MKRYITKTEKIHKQKNTETRQKTIKVTSRATIEFPNLNFSIEKGEVKTLPLEIEKEVLSNSNIKQLN